MDTVRGLIRENRGLEIRDWGAMGVATHFRTEHARQLLVLRVPGRDCVRQFPVLVAYADVETIVAAGAVELELLHLLDPLLEFDTLRQQLVTERGCGLELLFLVVEEVLEIEPHVSRRVVVGHGGHVAAVGEGGHRRRRRRWVEVETTKSEARRPTRGFVTHCDA